MRIAYTATAMSALREAPPEVQKAFFKQIKFLEQNLRHPSLKAKKYDETQDKWQGRVNLNWRFYFRIIEDTYMITDIMPHPK